jgi:hypothetical protein
MVPGGGVEPPRGCPRRILSPLRLPVPPSRHWEGHWLVYPPGLKEEISRNQSGRLRVAVGAVSLRGSAGSSGALGGAGTSSVAIALGFNILSRR